MQNLQKGGNISLTKIMESANSVAVSISWAKKPNDDNEFDIDASAFLLTEQKKVRTDVDFIFYNQPTTNDNSVRLIAQSDDKQLFNITLNSIANDIQTIAFTLTLHEAKERQQNFSQLANITIAVINPVNNNTLAVYTLESIETETALILSELYRYNNEWKFRAVGQGFMNGLDALARNFGVEIDAEPTTLIEHSQPEPIKPPTVVRYIEAIKPHITRFQEKAIIAKRESVNESRTRLLIDSLLQSILGYSLEHIRTEHRIPNRKTRADYMLSLNNKNILVIEAKPVNEVLKEAHVSQVTAYAYYLQIDFAVLTNGVHWQLYYVERKKLKKYKAHQVFSINLLEFNDNVAEKLFFISRFGISENSFESIKLKMNALNSITEVIVQDEIVQHITDLINCNYAGCQLTTDDVLFALENNVLN